ncbi:MAG: MFS transporter [Bacillota bacterium]|nr:MFS transporter [Bacillota bacterium]
MYAKTRWLYLIFGSITLLLGGIIYSWSILKSPLADEFGWNPAQLALNFTITICCFGTGGLVSGVLSGKVSPRVRLIISSVFVFLGFFLASRVSEGGLGLLYISYGMLGGLGIGILYNTTIATIGEWFPDRKGLASGIMLMCFGFSTLIFGGLAGHLMAMPDFGWRRTYLLLGICMAAVVFVFGLMIKRPDKTRNVSRADGAAEQSASDPASSSDSAPASDCAKAADLSALQMIRTGTFWKLFISLTLMAAIGQSVISFAKDFAIFTGSAETLAITVVGLLSVFNGLARICAGALYDNVKLRITQWIIAAIMVAAPLLGLLAAASSSQIIGIIALIVCGFSLGFCPTTSAVYPKIFFGETNYALNFSITNLTLIPTSFVATISGLILTSTGSYLPVFLMLLAFGIVGGGLLLLIRKP